MFKRIKKVFHKQEQFILALISGNYSLTNQRLYNFSKDINDLKESLEFSQNECDDQFKNIGDKIQKLEEKTKLKYEETTTRYSDNKTIMVD